MAHFLRGKQAGIKADLSAGLDAEFFAIDQVARYGINSQINALAYDPVQSLLAVGTKDTQYGPGQVYVFGQARVCQKLPLPRKASVQTLQFCADKLIVVDSKSDITVFSLENAKIVASYAPPGQLTVLVADPTLDFALIGLLNGDVVAYDLDRQGVTPYRICNIWKERNPRARLVPVVTLAFHPRDIGTLLIGYSEGAVIYSFQQDKPLKFFQYEVPAGAPGGDADPASISRSRFPKLTQALWHPTGTFVLTGHEDSSLVIWDPKDGRKVLARTLQANNIDKPGAPLGNLGSTLGTSVLKEPLFRVAWCSKENPDDTGILIAGGESTASPAKGLTFFDLGMTPTYATSSWQILSEHFEKPKRQHVLPTPPNAEVIDFCLIPRTSPHYAGSHDPIAVIALLASGEIVTLSFPSGHPIAPTNQLHVSLAYVHPFINRIGLSFVDRTRWLGMTESRSRGPQILKGGLGAKYQSRRFATRNIMQTAHADGTVRIWDAGHGDEIENEAVIQVDIARAIGRNEDVNITKTSMSGATGELAVGLWTGEVAVYRWGNNRNFGKDLPHRGAGGFGLEDIQDRAEPNLKQGLLPLTLLDQQHDPVTALKMSDIGFVAAGFQGGTVAVIDLRGPALIFEANIEEFSKTHKHGSLRRRETHSSAKAEWSTNIEFGVMSLEGEDYSSILLFIGTNLGRFLTFKILPQQNGGYNVQFAGAVSLDARVISISPIDTESGEPAGATQDVVARLRDGYKVNGVVVVVTHSGVRIFKPVAAKGAHKTWDEFLCDSAAVVKYLALGYALVGIFGDGCARAYSIPGLKEIASSSVTDFLDVQRFSEAVITPTGDIVGWAGPSEIAMLNAWGTGSDLSKSLDTIFNPEVIIPPRPTISNLQWISGTQYVTPNDLDILIGGPNRPPSKLMIAQTRAEEQERRLASRQATTPTSPSSSSRQEEGYWAYMQRQVQERAENLNIMGDSMDRLEDNSSAYANDVSKYVGKQKKKAVMSLIGSKFGF